MADVDTVRTIKTQTLARIEQITSQPSPNYDIDGQKMSWGDYLAQLQKTVEWCDTQIAAEEPFEIDSRAYT